jgi:4-amino-4-deoxy-L-arabinose transferase-like glycosyltransferase
MLVDNMHKKLIKLLNFKNILIFGLLLLAFILRIYRVGDILAFHYDQGRDALVIWDLIREPNKLFLIGPTTGLPGVFRGPFYYYLIAPFYFIGQGNPVFPAVFLAALSTLALYFMFLLGREVGGFKAGLLALLMGAFSFEIIYASRWLSNPTPMLLLSMLLIYSMYRIYEGRKNYWLLLSLTLGLSFFNFGSSGELFYFPVVLVFAAWSVVKQGFGRTGSTLNKNIFLKSAVLFFLTFAPLLLFNIRHGDLLAQNISSLIGSEPSFQVPTWRFLLDRGSQVVSYFMALIFHIPYEKEKAIQFFLIAFVLYHLPSVITKDKVKILVLFMFFIFIGLIFYRGNHGNLYAYYLTGYYLIFILLLAVILAKAFEKSIVSKMLIIYFAGTFILHNWSWTKPYLNANGDKSDEIVMSNQLKAIDWVYSNSEGREFNVDVYVPPVISYSYDYLFKWQGTEKYNKLPSDPQVKLLYTLYESDTEHPERVNAWLERQKGIGQILKKETFGGITVEERTRINLP